MEVEKAESAKSHYFESLKESHHKFSKHSRLITGSVLLVVTVLIVGVFAVEHDALETNV